MGFEAEIGRGARCQKQLRHRPFLPGGGIAAHLLGRKAVEQQVVGRVHGDELALDMGR